MVPDQKKVADQRVFFFKAASQMLVGADDADEFFTGFAEVVKETSTSVICENVQVPKAAFTISDGRHEFTLSSRQIGDVEYPSERFAVIAVAIAPPSWFRGKRSPS
jgi:hypothetical protein